VAVVASLLACAGAADAQPTTRITVTSVGNGPDVLLIPGLASSAAVWDATAKSLSERYRVHVVQVKGFAGVQAGVNVAPPLLSALTDEIAGYARQLKRPVIVGHSVGGLIALQIAARHAADVSGVVVIDALPFYSLLFSPAATPAMVEPQASLLRLQLLGQSDDEFARSERMAIAGMVKTADAQPLVLEWALRSDRRTVAAAMYDAMVTDARPELTAIQAPVTVLYAYDAAMGRPPEALDRLYRSAYANLRGVKLRRIDGSFHFIMLDQPDAFGRELAGALGAP
jgi:pimeloyl-ACP methyl ester carboxylesterase